MGSNSSKRPMQETPQLLTKDIFATQTASMDCKLIFLIYCLYVVTLLNIVLTSLDKFDLFTLPQYSIPMEYLINE